MSAAFHPLFDQLRSRALAWQDPEAPEGSPSGIIMETGYAEGVVMLVAMSTGTVDLYFSQGGGVMGAGAHPGPAKAARALAVAAAQMAAHMPVAFEFPLPQKGVVTLYVLIDGVVRGVSGREKDFAQGRAPFSELFHAAHHVIEEIKRLPPPNAA